MRQPPGGVPDVDISAGTMFVARVPTYCTCDAGRGFWKKLRHDILSTGLKENAVIRALYIYQEDGDPQSMFATHVDDMLCATKPGYEDRVQQLLDRYTIKTVESGMFRFCGREVIQHSDFSVSVKCKDTTEKIEPVRYDTAQVGGRFPSPGCKAMQASAFIRCEQATVRMRNCHT